MLKEQGKRLLTLDGYIASLTPFEVQGDDHKINQYGAITTGNNDEYFLVQTSENAFRMMPGPEFSPRLYRGQVSRHSPCKPSLFRVPRYVDCIFWGIKSLEFSSFLGFHPAVRDIRNWEFDALRFDLDFPSIAQHYQYPTSILDLSRSRDVAMFFATHKFEESCEEPVPAKGATAVLYTVDVARLMQDRPLKRRLVPIGIDPLPRSAAQRAFGLELDIGDDFERLPGVHTESFEVTEALANECAERVGGYEALFPSDPFEEVIHSLRDNGVISKRALELSLKIGVMPSEYRMQDLQDMLHSGGYRTSIEDPDCKPSDELIQAAALEWAQRRAAYFGKIRIRGAADHLQR